MDIRGFQQQFAEHFPEVERGQPTPVLEQTFTRSFFDPCFNVPGMTAVKNQFLLKLAFACIAQDECYLEVGTWLGKTLISAAANNVVRKAYACDDFSEYTPNPELSLANLRHHLQLYGLKEKVTFYNDDFRNIMDRDHVPEPVGLYLYDGGHSEQDHEDGIVLAEPLLADEALVVIDDWNFEEAPKGAEKAVAASQQEWERLYVLPARTNGDHGLWWNGVAVYAFRRTGNEDDHAV